MSPEERIGGKKPTASDNIYTVILLFAFGAVLATAALVVYKCYFQYGTVFGIP